MINIKELKFII